MREKVSRDREREQRLRASHFWKMVYENFFCKPFSNFVKDFPVNCKIISVNFIL